MGSSTQDMEITSVSSYSQLAFPTILEIYQKIYIAMQVSGSSCFILKKHPKDTLQSSPMDSIPQLGYATNSRFLFVYYGTKLVSVFHLIFFIIRFFNLISCDTKFCEDKGVLLLAITTYIWGLVMVLGIYALCHLKRAQICDFFGKLNQLDQFIFNEDMMGRQKYIQKHWVVYNRVKIYIPIMIFVSVVLIGMNHANHPRFLAHITSLALTEEGDTFFMNWKTTCVTIFSFALEFLMVIYLYLALYQYLFMAIVVARCFNWCLQALTQHSAKLFLEQDSQARVKTVETVVAKFEHIRGLLNEYNGIFSGLLLFCKGMLLIEITIMAYIPLKRMYILPFSSILIFFALASHYGTQVVILLFEMGRVVKASKQLPEFWMRNLLGSSQPIGFDKNETLAKLKMLLDTCTPFGFEGVGSGF
ncbi:unnamed protein product [Orchesella dallaii]|uniref:Gustatory receptor n=1 Tax=Orchesella dallaii TaxID=48710 RepID=A0ABP1Q9E2_9HEXA